MLMTGSVVANDRYQKVSEQIEYMRSGKIIPNSRSEHAALLQDLLDSNLPEAEKARTRIRDEAQTLIGAGTSTV